METKDLLRRVLQFGVQHPDERDSWMKAPLLTAAIAHGTVEDFTTVQRWLDRSVATQRSDGNLSYADALQGLTSGHIRSYTPLASLCSAIGYPLLLAYQKNQKPEYLTAARRQYDALQRAPRTSEGGVWARAEGPELWVDFTYLMGPFMALYGLITDATAPVDDAFLQFEVHAKHLLDSRKKLARHAWCERPDHYPQSTFWTRGNGWLVCAGVDLLALVPNHHAADSVRSMTTAVLHAMAAYQESSGYFCHVLDDPRSNLEASGTLMYAYAVAKATSLGFATQDLMAGARRAFDVVAGAVEPTGKVPGVAVPPGGPGVPFDWTLFGQGFFVLAGEALLALPEVGQ